ncbi:MAG: AMP-binding enzyme, partial [Acidimicrobiia bacterium]
LKEMIIRGGENVYPREIEDALSEHPDLSEVAVVGVPDERWGEQVVAVVRLLPGREPQPEEWIAFARDRLAAGKIPRRWCTVDAMPVTASGKIQKYRLRELIEAGETTDVTPPR